jgi:hypothetical protein
MTQIQHRLHGEGDAQPNDFAGPAPVGEYPAHGTQAARLLAYLLQEREVGPLDALRELGIYRLSDTKFRLRKAGWPVEKVMLQRLNQFGEDCGFAIYSIPLNCIEAAGEVGQEFAQTEIALMGELLSKQRGH